MENKSSIDDGSLINIIKSYHDYENEKKKITNNSTKQMNMENYSIEEKESFLEQSQDSVLFSNFFIQNSLTRFNILKKILFKKQNTLLIYYLDKWQRNIHNMDNRENIRDLQSSVEIEDYNHYNLIDRQKNDSKDYLQKNREIIETYCEESITSYSEYDYLNVNTSTKFEKFDAKTENKIYSTSNKINDSNEYDYDYPLQSQKETIPNKYPDNNKKSLCLVLKNILLNKYKTDISFLYGKLQLYINSKKLANSSLSLLYIFTELAISKNKLKNSSKNIFIGDQESSYSNNISSKNAEISQIKQKLEEYEKKISKYETNLNEKAMIIESRNDRIEGLLETNEALQEEIKKLSNKVDRLERKTKNLNIVEESLCKNCGNSLEESFMSHPKDSPRKDHHMINELKKIIQEQLDYIVKMENDSKELRIKNEEYRKRNEMIKEELDIIKEEFRLFSDGLSSKKNINTQIFPSDQDLNNTVSILKINLTDASTQTGLEKSEIENSLINKNQILSKNKKISSTSTISSTSLKKSTKKFSNKLTLNKDKESHSQSLTSTSNNITNYNIININNSNSSNNFSTPSNTSGKISHSGSNSNYSLSTINDTEREVVQSLRFDNSLLTQEIVNLNKELTKSKNEMKSYIDNFKKLEKEKNDLLLKFKSKTENFDKIKKENEELMILINTSNYKSFISVESENKKLKTENQSMSKELENFKTDLMTKEKKLNEIETELNTTKKLCENLNKFKTEREDLVLENAKLDSELKQSKYEVESSKNLIERQNILLKRQDETINKMNEDMNYINFNAKKCKSEADRAREDSVTYQQIVRKLEKDLSEAVTKKEKVENELNIIKQQLGQFGNFSFKNNK
jgi:chromosome segregation ATPase